MLADVEADILFIFGDSHPQGSIDNKCNAIGHHKSEYECSNCAYGIYCKLPGVAFNQIRKFRQSLPPQKCLLQQYPRDLPFRELPRHQDFHHIFS